MTYEFSAEGRAKLTEPWEECVLYVYDDKIARRRIDGRLQYPEWCGGPVKGTLTVGFGHTDAAGRPEIVRGMRITRAQADEILSKDLAPCVRRVNALLRVKVTQHQFDALVDTYFNCPAAAIAAIRLINAGNIRAVPSKLLQYTYSKGQHMNGLVHRRAAEISWFHTPDDPEEADTDVVFSPKAERNPPPKPMAQSKVGAASGAIVAGGTGSIIASIQAANDAAEPIKQAKQNLADLGVFDHLGALAHTPGFAIIAAAVVIVLGAFVWLDRFQKLKVDNV